MGVAYGEYGSVRCAEHSMDYLEAISFSNLYKGLLKSKKGVMWKESVAGYYLRGLENTYRLRESLLDGTYKIDKYGRFQIKEPKVREILATRIKDRSLQRSLNDNIVYHSCADQFIETNCACQLNKGVDFAINKTKQMLRDYYWEHHSNEGYICQTDVHHFFPDTSLKQSQRKAMQYIKDKESAARVCEIIESFSISCIIEELKDNPILPQKYFKDIERIAYEIASFRSTNKKKLILNEITDEAFHKDCLNMSEKLSDKYNVDSSFILSLITKDYKGIGLGSQTSQIMQLTLLDDLDHVISQKHKYYMRYMDDIYVICDTKEEAKSAIVEIRIELQKVGLTLNPKSKVFKIKENLKFLQWTFVLTPTGKVVMKMSKNKIKRQKRKLKKIKERIDSGEGNIEYARNSFQSWQANAERGNTRNQVFRLRQVYFKLFKEDAPYGNKWYKCKRPCKSTEDCGVYPL